MCSHKSLCTTVVHNAAQNSSGNLQTVIVAQMLSIRGEGCKPYNSPQKFCMCFELERLSDTEQELHSNSASDFCV